MKTKKRMEAVVHKKRQKAKPNVRNDCVFVALEDFWVGEVERYEGEFGLRYFCKLTLRLSWSGGDVRRRRVPSVSSSHFLCARDLSKRSSPPTSASDPHGMRMRRSRTGELWKAWNGFFVRIGLKGGSEGSDGTWSLIHLQSCSWHYCLLFVTREMAY